MYIILHIILHMLNLLQALNLLQTMNLLQIPTFYRYQSSTDNNLHTESILKVQHTALTNITLLRQLRHPQLANHVTQQSQLDQLIFALALLTFSTNTAFSLTTQSLHSSSTIFTSIIFTKITFNKSQPPGLLFSIDTLNSLTDTHSRLRCNFLQTLMIAKLGKSHWSQTHDLSFQITTLFSTPRN